MLTPINPSSPQKMSLKSYTPSTAPIHRSISVVLKAGSLGCLWPACCSCCCCYCCFCCCCCCWCCWCCWCCCPCWCICWAASCRNCCCCCCCCCCCQQDRIRRFKLEAEV